MSFTKLNRRSMFAICVTVALMLPIVFAPAALAADPPTLEATYLGTGALLAADNVHSNSTFKLDFSSNVTVDTYWTANQAYITLLDSSSNNMAVNVTRVGTGQSTDPERDKIFLAPSAPLTVGETYTIRIDPNVTANNGLSVGAGTGGAPILVSFTVSAMSGELTVTNHLTVDSYLTVVFGTSDLYYTVSSLTDAPSASTTVGVQSNDDWTRTITWGDLTGTGHGGTIAAADFGGVSDLNGVLTAAGPNTFTGTPTTTYMEILTFTYNNAASNPRADTYTGTINIAVLPVL